MTDLISRPEMRHQLNLMLAARPFDCDQFKDGQYAGLRAAVRLLDAMPAAEHSCACEVTK